ncbi:MAG: hypothetical protein IPK64_21935 [bacterium]|nr:hypothetical protein [bacterium]
MSNVPLTVPLNPPVLDRSRPVVRRPVELATHLGLKVYNRTFPRMEAAVFLAEVVAHLQGRASRDYAAEIDQVTEAIVGELDRLEAFVTGESRQLANAARRSPPAGAPVEVGYTGPARVELTMRTPAMRRYAGLVAAVEDIARALDLAWYGGALTTPARLARENGLFRQCARACGVIERLARGLARRVRDDSEAPGYRDMLVKRTGRGPDAPAPAVKDEGREEMTDEERRSLQATDALAGAWLADEPGPGDGAPGGPDAVADGETVAGAEATEPGETVAGAEATEPGEAVAGAEATGPEPPGDTGETAGGGAPAGEGDATAPPPDGEAPAETAKPRRRVRELCGGDAA